MVGQADHTVAPPEQPVGDKIIFMQPAFGVMQQLPDLGAVELVPGHRIVSAVGRVKIVEQVFADKHAGCSGVGVAWRVKACAVFGDILHRTDSHVRIMRLAGVVELFQVVRPQDIV